MNWFVENWSTLSVIIACVSAAGGGFWWLIKFLEWESPLEKQRIQGRKIERVETSLERHLDECSESNREVLTRIDGLESKIDKLAGAVEVLKDRL